jgi:translocation and assembly module TamB
MKRLVPIVLTATLLLATATGGIWLGFSESGLGALARLAAAASSGRLSLEQPSGRLVGPLAFARVAWNEPGTGVVIERLQLDWSSSALLKLRLSIAEIAAARVAVEIAGSDEASEPPPGLRLPLAVDVKKIAISRLDYGKLFAIDDLRATFTSDGINHRLSGVHGQLGKTAIVGEMALGGDAPLPLQASVTLSGQIDEQPVRLVAEAGGTLARIVLKVSAVEGLRGDGQATLTPFDRHAFAEAQLALDDVDPAAWIAGAPQARLTLRAQITPDDRREVALTGDFSVGNSIAGPLDRQRLPLENMSGRFDWADDGIRISALRAALPGQGRLNGGGHWRDGSLDLDLDASALDAAQVASVLRSTRLNGPISARIGTGRQRLSIKLADPRFALDADAAHENGQVSLSRLELGAGEARLTLRGELDMARNMAFSISGELTRFDPRRFARVPAALLNGTLSASGSLNPRPVVAAQFALRDSQLAGRPLIGHGDLAIDWPRIPRADVELAAGPNRLTARGAFGQAGDTLRIDVEAPDLAPYGADGSLSGHLRLGGTLAQPTLAADLATPRLGLPGIGRLKEARLVADLGSQPDSPLKFEATVATFDGADQPGLLRKLEVHVAGTRRQHSLRVAGEVAGSNALKLAAEGGIADAGPQLQWSGHVLEASLVARERFRSFTLSEPAAITLGVAAWRVGPLLLAGEDWQLRLQATAGAQRLQGEVSGRGPRLGNISGQIEAAMRDAWTLNRQATWQGTLRMDVPDLAWVAELLGESWKSGGRFDGELKLAGTPDHPLASGRFTGEALTLTLPEQGMRLTDGVLDARLDDNLLRVSRLAFDSPLQPAPRPLQRLSGETLEKLTVRPGRLEIAGQMRVDRGNEEATLDLHLDRVGVYQLPGQWMLVSGDSTISLLQDALAVRGRLAVDAAFWQMAPMGAPRLSDDVVVRTADGDPVPNAFRPRLDLDLETDLGRNFHFRGLGLEARLAGSVRLRAEGRDLPRASGRIRTQGGRYDAFGQQLEIERGILTFQGLLDNPAIDARAVRRGLAVEAGVQISGTVQRPVVRLFSDPDLPDVEKLSWLVLGHGPEQGGEGAALLLLSAAGSLFGNDSGGLMRQIKQGFGIDEFSVRQGDIGGGGGRQLGSRVVGSSFNTTAGTGDQILSIGRRLSNNVLLSYDQALGRAGSVVKLTISLNRQVSLVARAGSDNALDVLYTLTFGESARRQRAASQR